MDRVLVIGCPGAGKSTFSRKLATMTGLPLIHLDSHYHLTNRWPTDAGAKREAWRTFVAEIVRGESWIIDGNYQNSLDIRMPAADTIIFLDYPLATCLIRVFWRQLAYRNKPRPDMPATWKEKISWDFLFFVCTYRLRQRARVLALLEEHRVGRHIHVIHSPSDANRMLVHIREEPAPSVGT